MKTWEIALRKFDDPLTQLLYNRGIKTEKEIEEFLHPKLQNFEKDLDIPGIIKAKKRIEQAILNNELIMVFGDYDADGVCSLAVMYHAISELGGKFLPYIPHREKEGYGLSKVGLDYAKEKGVSLVITVDNGIVAQSQAKYAKKLNLDLIITDHHIPSEILPEAVAIVHSTKFCGTGVVWCLVREMVNEKSSNSLLDLVAIATVCDLVSLLGVNRCLVKMGLYELNHTSRVGLIALINESRLTKGEITTYHIGHILGPRLNALGRIEHAMDCLRLLCTKDHAKARIIVKHLTDANEQKKQLTVDAIDEAKEIISQIEIKKKIIIVYSDSWIPGIMGLVAGRLVEEYGLPAIAISATGSFARGSARSINGVNIVETIRRCSDLLIDVGGHPKAAGFSIEKRKIEVFKKKMEEIMESLEIAEGDRIKVEAVIDFRKINKELISQLEDFEPTGVDNPKPILASENMEISDIRTVGEGKHLKFKVSPSVILTPSKVEGEESNFVDAIAFSKGDLADKIKNGQSINLAYYLELDTYNGAEKIQLKVVDINYQ